MKFVHAISYQPGSAIRKATEAGLGVGFRGLVKISVGVTPQVVADGMLPPLKPTILHFCSSSFQIIEDHLATKPRLINQPLEQDMFSVRMQGGLPEGLNFSFIQGIFPIEIGRDHMIDLGKPRLIKAIPIPRQFLLRRPWGTDCGPLMISSCYGYENLEQLFMREGEMVFQA